LGFENGDKPVSIKVYKRSFGLHGNVDAPKIFQQCKVALHTDGIVVETKTDAHGDKYLQCKATPDAIDILTDFNTQADYYNAHGGQVQRKRANTSPLALAMNSPQKSASSHAWTASPGASASPAKAQGGWTPFAGADTEVPEDQVVRSDKKYYAGNTRQNASGEEIGTAGTNARFSFRLQGWTFVSHKVTKYPHWVSSGYARSRSRAHLHFLPLRFHPPASR